MKHLLPFVSFCLLFAGCSDRGADTQIDTALQDATLTITGFNHVYCRRESDIYLTENVGGVMYQHIGGTYRIIGDES